MNKDYNCFFFRGLFVDNVYYLWKRIIDLLIDLLKVEL